MRLGKADCHVAKWADSVDAADLYISVITMHELEIGVLLSERRDTVQGAVLRAWLNDQVVPAFGARILDIGQDVALRSAQLHVPNPQSIRDAFIAATALVHGLTVVTRNVKDFQNTGVKIINPWSH